MTVRNFIEPDNVLSNVEGRSKKHCLEVLSELLARSASGISNEEIFAKLVERERLGCTSLENGIAFPHCRLAGVDRSRGALMKLAEPIEFDSPDGEPVDLVFGLVVPEEISDEHRAEIAEITGLLEDPVLRERLRNASSSKELYSAFVAAGLNDEPRVQSARKA